MNILYLCDEYPPGKHGGIGTAVQLLAREMKRQGHNVVVAGFCHWGYGGENTFEDEGVKVYRFRRKLDFLFSISSNKLIFKSLFKLSKVFGLFDHDIKASILKYGEFLEQIIERHNIDIIEMADFHDYMDYSKSYLPFPKLSRASIVKLHGSHTYFAYEAGSKVPDHLWQMEHDLLRQASAVTSVSKYTAQRTAEYLKYDREITVVYNGVKNIYDNQLINKALGQVIFSGTLVEKKGIFQLAKAWNSVNERFPEARLLIYGKGNTDEIKKCLNERAIGSVIFKGHVSREELLGSLRESQVGVFPSFAESFGLAPVEAMMCGTASIFTKTTSGPEIIDDGIDGFLVDPHSPKEIADKIITLLSDKDLCDTFAQSGKEKIKNRFDIKIIAQRHTQYYEAILS